MHRQRAREQRGHTARHRRCARTPLYFWLSLVGVLALFLQGCNSLAGDNGQFRPALTSTSGGGTPLEVNSEERFPGKIAFVRNHRLYVLDGTTGEITPLNAGDDVSDPAYSPDGTHLAFISRSASWSDLLVMPADGGTPTALTHSQGSGQITCPSGITINNQVWVANPVWSASGDTIFYLSDHQKLDTACGFSDMGIWKMTAAGTDPQLLLPPALGDENSGLPGAGGDTNLSLRPGNDPSLAYTHYAYDAQNGTTLLIQLFLGMLDGEQETALSPTTLNQAPEQARQPAWSPDGHDLAYIRQDGSSTDLMVMRVSDPADGAPDFGDYATRITLLDGQITYPVWSPDGKDLLFLAYKDDAYNLYLAHLVFSDNTIGVAGSPLQLTQGGVDGDTQPAWTGK
ncbi:MAG TPA: LpqB family beta-propeller domain-containing protein [Ktedonobacterales bacterium]